MALWVCGQCATAYAVGLPACPQCGSGEYRPDYEEDSVANITSAGTFYDEGREPDGYTDPRSEAPAEAPAPAPAEEPQAPPEPEPAPAPPAPPPPPPASD